MNAKKWMVLSLVLVMLAAAACGVIPDDGFAENSATETAQAAESAIPEGEPEAVTERPAGWTLETHSNEARPDYETVFPQDKVNRMDILLTPETWDAMLADMTEMQGEFGAGAGMGAPPAGGPGDRMPPDGGPQEGGPPEGERPPLGGQAPEGGGLPGDRQPPQGGPGGMNNALTDENPIWVTATIQFEGNTWEYVGLRFKGNSSLMSAWRDGNFKLPFRLDFDQFEDTYPQIDDQRFYGFKQLSLASNFNDDSYLREKVTADIFRGFGVPSAHTAFYEVYVDYGEGPVYFGLYTMVEMVEDTVIEEQFVSDDGNLYKPEGAGATFAAGSFSEVSFDKETNQEANDYSDILAVFDALHAATRLEDPAVWRDGLEAVFDVEIFLRWLAVNTVVQNWDTYGVMHHNYFLYTDPETGLVTWIPWDNNHALFGAGMRPALSLSLEEVGEEWPLIRFLMDDPVYQAQYDAYLGEVVETVFVPEEMSAVYQVYHDLIAESALKETPEATMLRSQAAFEASVDELTRHVQDRCQAVRAYLGE
jgi:spore coat protein H